MKTIRCGQLAGVLLLGGFGVSAAGVSVGDSLEEAVAELGEPQGMIVINETKIFYYERGRVEIHEGVVTEAEVLSEEAYEAKRLAEERERQARRAEGLEVLERKLADPAFLNAPAAQRLAYYRAFRGTYPEVALPTDYEFALREREAELRVEESEARIRRLEQRVALAEQRAYDAQQEAYLSYANAYAYPRYGAYPAVYVTGSTYGYGKSYVRDRYRKGYDHAHHAEAKPYHVYSDRSTRISDSGHGHQSVRSRDLRVDNRGRLAYRTSKTRRIDTGFGVHVGRTHNGFVRGATTRTSTIRGRSHYHTGSASFIRSAPISHGITHVTAGH